MTAISRLFSSLINYVQCFFRSEMIHELDTHESTRFEGFRSHGGLDRPPQSRGGSEIRQLHDTTYMNVDRAEMDRNMFAALKPGGFLVIADHSALPGQGTSVGKTLHRIEESTLRKEVEAAGFRVVLCEI